MNMNLKRIFFALLIFFSVSFPLFPQVEKEKFENYLTEYHQNKNVPSITGGISEKGKIIWINSRGMTDIENNVKASPSSVYRIASISKSITAVAIMKLYEEKKLDINADVMSFFPNAPKKRWRFTIKQILNHTSGIRNYKDEKEFDSKENFSTTEEIIRYVLADSLVYEPGTKYLYSTLAYNLLSGIIEKVTGITFNDYMVNNIFQPLKMNSTYLDYYEIIILNRASGYVKNIDRSFANAPLADLTIKFPGGGFVSTVEDLLKFGNALLTNQFISDTSLKKLITPTVLRSGEKINYGLGFILREAANGKMIFGHTGGGTGFTSNLLIYPNEKIVSVHLINLRDRELDNPAEEFVNIFQNKEPKKVLKNISNELIPLALNSSIKDAIKFYKKEKLNPDIIYLMNEKELDFTGRKLLQSNKNSEAILIYLLMLEEFPDKVESHIGLADSYYISGNKIEALKYFRSALQIDKNNNYALIMISKIKSEK